MNIGRDRLIWTAAIVRWMKTVRRNVDGFYFKRLLLRASRRGLVWGCPRNRAVRPGAPALPVAGGNAIEWGYSYRPVWAKRRME